VSVPFSLDGGDSVNTTTMEYSERLITRVVTDCDK